MRNVNKMRLIVSTFISTTLYVVCTISVCGAEMVTFQKEYTYQASEADSKLTCRAMALTQVKRLLLEEIGAYLESGTEVKDFQLSKDQITTITAGIVQTEILEEHWDGKTYHLIAKMVVDPQEVAQSINSIRQDNQKVDELEAIKKTAQEALTEVEKLKQELSSVKGEGYTERKQEYVESVKKLDALDWLKTGYALHTSGKHQESISAYTKAIELNPKLAKAYVGRGVTHMELGDYTRSIFDYTQAIKLDPGFAQAYFYRAIAYKKQGKHARFMRNLKIAAKLKHEKAIKILRSQSLKRRPPRKVSP